MSRSLSAIRPLHRRARTQALVVVPLLAVLAACGGEAPAPAAGGAAVQFTEANWTPKREADIPNDSMGASIRRGLYLMRFTPESLPDYATSGLRCTSCHQEDGLKLTAAPLTGSHARFPKYMARTGTTITLADRVNYCFTRSLAGNVLPVESREMTDLLAYMQFISQDVPTGYKLAGHDGLVSMPDTLDGDATRGERLFTEKTCVTCHGANGDGWASCRRSGARGRIRSARRCRASSAPPASSTTICRRRRPAR
jgi:thiosulfate dehydrogenase